MSVRKVQQTLGLEHCLIIGIPTKIWYPIAHDVNRWLTTNGTEWTVNRLKDIKLDFIRAKAGLKPCSTWIKKDNRTGHFKGSYGSLQKWCSVSFKRWSKAIVFLQMYTQFISPSVTKSQREKFISGVCSAPLQDSETSRDIHSRLAIAASMTCKRRPIIRVPRPLVSVIPSSSRREPHASGRSFPEGQHTLECAASYLYGTKVGHQLRRDYREIFNHVLPGFRNIDSRDVDYVSTVVYEYDNCVGKIGLIQEPGFKLRSVANPARVYQCALGPLGDGLFDILKTLPWDCTHDQHKPFSQIRAELLRGKTAHSVDLSSATDYFPLELQMTVLHSIFVDSQYVSLFGEISRANWLLKGEHIRWSRGQPLGLYPSFASFALTHGLLLYSLNNFCHNEDFYVLGDDVVILNDDLHDKYIATLNELGCPISQSKSLSSKHVCEFGGKIITPEGVVHPLKWRKPTDDSFIDFVRNFGHRGVSMLKPRQRKIVEILSEVPDFVGGLGWNPRGLPLEERLAASQFLLDRDSSRSYFMSYNRLLNTAMYSPQPEGFTFRSFHHGDVSLDQSVIDAVSKHLPKLRIWYSVLGKNLYSIQPDLFLALDQPSGRRSTLEQYEAMLL